MYSDKEVNNLIKKKKIILTTYGHNGLDWLQSMIDGNSKVLMMPAFSFFRTIRYLKITKELNFDEISQKISLIFFKDKSYQVRRRKFIYNKNEYLNFKKNLRYYLKKNLSNNFYENIFLSIHLSFAQLKKIDIKKIGCIICQEHLSTNLYLYKKFFQDDLNFIVMMRNPKAAIAGSINSQKKSNNNKFLPAQDFILIMHTWFAGKIFFKSIKKPNVYTVINEKINQYQKHELIKLFKWIGVKIEKINFRETILRKNWNGESSYLKTNKEKDLIKKVPKNFYSSRNVEKRWRSILDKKTILVIESLLFDIFFIYKYKTDFKINPLIKLKALITYIFLFRKIKYYNRKRFFILTKAKYFLKKIIIIKFPFFASKFFHSK